MTRPLGPVQRQVLLVLSLDHGRARSASTIDNDLLLTPGRAAGALRGLWTRGLVDRAFDYNRVKWFLTAAGEQLVEQLDAEDET